MAYTIKAVFLSVLYWLLDSAIHCFIYGEGEFQFIPSELNELWMRIIIVVLLVAFGMYADRETRLLLEKEQEKRAVFKATIFSANHILNNLLNQMQYFKMKADESSVFDARTIALYEQTMAEGKELVDKLNAVEDLTEDNIKASVYPQSDK